MQCVWGGGAALSDGLNSRVIFAWLAYKTACHRPTCPTCYCHDTCPQPACYCYCPGTCSPPPPTHTCYCHDTCPHPTRHMPPPCMLPLLPWHMPLPYLPYLLQPRHMPPPCMLPLLPWHMPPPYPTLPTPPRSFGGCAHPNRNSYCPGTHTPLRGHSAAAHQLASPDWGGFIAECSPYVAASPPGPLQVGRASRVQDLGQQGEGGVCVGGRVGGWRGEQDIHANRQGGATCGTWERKNTVHLLWEKNMKRCDVWGDKIVMCGQTK